MEKACLPYLDEWEESIHKREGFNKDEKNRMHLSTQTTLGLRMTGKYIYVSENKKTYSTFLTLSTFLCAPGTLLVFSTCVEGKQGYSSTESSGFLVLWSCKRQLQKEELSHCHWQREQYSIGKEVKNNKSWQITQYYNWPSEQLMCISTFLCADPK